MLITLTTDFGYVDPFVGIMKGVIARINPQAQIVDISHGVPPQNIMAAALMLRHAVSYFPPGTIHLAVVDPGVGSERRPLLVECEGNYFIGPDNGVLSLALENKQPTCLVHLSNPAYHLQPVSATFHGRDVFAPVAAYCSLGVDPSAFGAALDNFVRVNWPSVMKSDNAIEGEIVYIDRFGNLFTNVREQDLTGFRREHVSVRLGEVTIHGLASNYASARGEKFVAIINSWRLLEIASRNDSAQRRTSAKIGDKVQILVDS
jgi:S-adenosylmethionine hydrolase